MKPFSALYFVRENKTRCIVLMFMLFLGYAAYLGGIYVTNPFDNWQLVVDYYENFAEAYQSADDEDGADFLAFCEALENDSRVDVVQLGINNSFNWNTIMGFGSGNYSFTFLSVDDFKTYCAKMNIECDFDSLTSGSLIMSERFAKNRGLELGDVIDKDYSFGVYGSFTLDAMTGEDGYTLYFIDGDSGSTNHIMVLGDEIDGSAVYEIVYDLQKKHDIMINDFLNSTLKNQFKSFNIIYMFILFLTSLILAVTINAVFVGMYQQRNYEFAVYRAIGVSRRRIIGKIAGELLCMDAIALTIGGCVFFLGLYLFNNLVLYPVGKYLRYFHPMALFGLLLCNLAVIIPLIVTRCRQMLKADICEY